MKTYKVAIPLKYTAIIKPILPRITALDGLGSVFNLTGAYYDTEPKLEALCSASENIVTVKRVWQRVGRDIDTAISEFAKTNSINRKSLNR